MQRGSICPFYFFFSWKINPFYITLYPNASTIIWLFDLKNMLVRLDWIHPPNFCQAWSWLCRLFYGIIKRTYGIYFLVLQYTVFVPYYTVFVPYYTIFVPFILLCTVLYFFLLYYIFFSVLYFFLMQCIFFAMHCTILHCLVFTVNVESTETSHPKGDERSRHERPVGIELKASLSSDELRFLASSLLPLCHGSRDSEILTILLSHKTTGHDKINAKLCYTRF